MKSICAFVMIGVLSISQSEPNQLTATPELTTTVHQEESPSDAPVQSPSDLPTVVAPQSVLEAPIFDGVAPGTAPQNQGALLIEDFSSIPVPVPPIAQSNAPCQSCHAVSCQCPVKVDLVLVEPDCGCSYEVCLTVPACCVGKAPQVTWRNGILGRKIAKLCWTCCDKRVKVVIPAIGGPRVWE